MLTVLSFAVFMLSLNVTVDEMEEGAIRTREGDFNSSEFLKWFQIKGTRRRVDKVTCPAGCMQ